ncbi:MAG: T9SS type A sorting domain-containing protein [Bacteroidota bacterium]
MKKIIVSLIITISLLSSAFGQDSLTWANQTTNTFYVIPPTNGCNGIWAINHNLFPGCASFTYLQNPCWLSQSWTTSGDTLFVTLCSVPCEIVASCFDGATVICGTGTPIYTSVESISENSNELYEILTGHYYSKSNEGIKLNVEELSEIKLTNEQGQVIAKKRGTGIIEINIQGLSSGLYFISISSEKFNHAEKIIIE